MEVDESPVESSSGAQTVSAVEDVDTELKAVLVAAGVSIVGSFLPWYTILGITVFGFEGDGVITLLTGIVVAGLVWHFDDAKRSLVAGVVGGLVVTFVAFYHVTGVSGIGVYVTLFAGLGMLAAGASGYRKLP